MHFFLGLFNKKNKNFKKTEVVFKFLKNKGVPFKRSGFSPNKRVFEIYSQCAYCTSSV